MQHSFKHLRKSRPRYEKLWNSSVKPAQAVVSRALALQLTPMSAPDECTNFVASSLTGRPRWTSSVSWNLTGTIRLAASCLCNASRNFATLATPDGQGLHKRNNPRLLRSVASCSFSCRLREALHMFLHQLVVHRFACPRQPGGPSQPVP